MLAQGTPFLSTTTYYSPTLDEFIFRIQKKETIILVELTMYFKPTIFAE